MERRFTFRRRQRLSRQRDFESVFARRCSAGDRLLVVYVEANDLPWTRLGLKVGKRLGTAVQRNQIKRRVREAFRLLQHELPAGLDVVCIPRPPSAAGAEVDELGRSLQRLIRQARRKLARRADSN